MHHLTRLRMGRGWRGALVHILLNPCYYKNTLKNKRLFGQSQSPGAWGSSVCLPRLSPLYSCQFLSELQLFPAHLDRTLNKTQEDLIPSHFPQEEYIQLQQPIVWIMITVARDKERAEKAGWGGSHRWKHGVKKKTTACIERCRMNKPDYRSRYSLDAKRFETANFHARPFLLFTVRNVFFRQW